MRCRFAASARDWRHRRINLSASSDHVIVLPGGGYAEHAANEGEPIAQWLQGFGVAASVFHYPLMAQHPAPLNALRAEIRRVRAAGWRTPVLS
jgi:acetyl esterase/lipase